MPLESYLDVCIDEKAGLENTMSKRMITPIRLFFCISYLGILTFFVYAYFHGRSAFDWLAMENNPDLNFIDFFMHICYVGDRHTLYTHAGGQAGTYPALAYLIYHFCYKLLYTAGYIPSTMYDAMNMPYGMLLFVYYSIFCAVFMFIAIAMVGKKNMLTDAFLFFALIMSVPFFAGGVEKGNSVIIVVILLIFALILKDSDIPWKREVALVLIAVCAGLKIYPAVFGLLYLLERRFKEAVRLTLYGVIMFFPPYLFFGRMAGFRLWLDNIRGIAQMTEYGRIQFIKGAVYTGLRDLTGREFTTIANVAPYVFLILMLVMCVVSRSRYRRIFYLCALMSLFANYSYRYALCYLSIPLILFVKERLTPDLDVGSESADGQAGIWEYIIMSLYGLIFTIPTWWGAMTGFELNHGAYVYIMTYVDLYTYIMVYLLVVVVVIREIIALRTGH